MTISHYFPYKCFPSPRVINVLQPSLLHGSGCNTLSQGKECFILLLTANLQMFHWNKSYAKLMVAWLSLSAQGSHRLEKYLNILDCLEKSLKMKFILKST